MAKRNYNVLPDGRRVVYINDIYIPFLEDRSRYLCTFGGKGSGKSEVNIFKCIHRLMTEHEEGHPHKILFCRKTKTSIKESMFDLAKTIIVRDFNNLQDWEINQTDKSLKYLPTGGRIISAGLDKVERLKSINGITSIYVDEITECSSDDLLELDSRMRGSSPFYFQLQFSFNPVDAEHWVKNYCEPDGIDFKPLEIATKFLAAPSSNQGYTQSNTLADEFITEENRKHVWTYDTVGSNGQSLTTSVWNTTYIHNFYLDDNYENVVSSGSPMDVMVNKHGRWGKQTSDSPAHWGFQQELHITEKAVCDPENMTHLAIDQNSIPYMTTLPFQISHLATLEDYDLWQVRLYDEVCSEPPRSTVVLNARDFKEEYPVDYLRGGLRYWSDVSMKKGSTLVNKGVTGLSQLHEEYLPYLIDKRLRKQKGGNPSVKDSLDFFNRLMAGEVVGGLKIIFEVNPKCKNFIADMLYQELDVNGKPQKKMVLNKLTKVRYEKYGHCSDATRYFFVNAFEKYWLKFIGKSTEGHSRQVAWSGYRRMSS